MFVRGKKIFLLLTAGVSLLCGNLPGQVKTAADTISIKEVVISSKITGSLNTGYKRTDIGQSALAVSRQKNLAEVISENSLIFIKSYGLGGIATSSLRGSGASQTQVTWNEININNPMPGQSDLALIPSIFIDNIQIYYGGSSMVIAGGGIGGIINLETKPEWKKETSVSLNPGTGSFGKYTGSVNIKTGNNNFQSVTRAYMESAENDFRYINDVITAEPVTEIRKNSQMKQSGFLQEIYYRRNKSATSARVWYQAARRNLPAPMIVQDNKGERQTDESLRTMLNHDAYKTNIKYSFTGAAILSRLNYFNPLVSIDSKNISGKYVFKTKMEASLSDNIVLKTSFIDELSVIKSNNYGTTASRNAVNMTVSLEKIRNERWGSSILIREIIHDKIFLFPDFAAGIEYKVSDQKMHFIKGNISRNSKIPAMNDLFWLPGGNPELRNEYAVSGELIYQADQKISSRADLFFDISLFRNSVRDMIQWRPGEFAYWTADNIDRVTSMGAEATSSLTMTYNDLSVRLNANYSFTRARAVGQEDAVSGGKQLIYVPAVQSNAWFNMWYRNLHASWLTAYTGKVFITPDNTDHLPGYILNTVKAGYKFDINGNSLDIQFDINNLFNVSYQVIAMHPMPGRYFSFTLFYNIIK